ncbi:MAG: hypothetical protein ACI9KE_004418 [Polyangiales bacterium]|jgi:hypothetical protein
MMNIKTKTLRVIALLGATAAAAAFVVMNENERAPGTTEEVAQVETNAMAASAAASNEVPLRPSGCELLPGTELSYRLSIHSEGEIAPALANMPSDGPSARISQESAMTLDLRSLSSSDQGTVLLARFRDVRSNAIADVGTLSAPFLLNVSQRCAIDAFARLVSTPRAHARTQQTLVHQLEWTWPESNGLAVEGENALGRYEARAGLVIPNGEVSDEEFVVEQRVVAYSAFWDRSAVGEALERRPVSSMTRIHVGSGPWFETLSLRETLSGEGVRVDNRVLAERDVDGVLDGEVEAALEDAPEDPAEYIWENLLATNPQLRTARPVTQADLDARNAVRHQSPSQSVTAFVQRTAAGVGIADSWPPLTAYLEARPETAEGVVDELRAGEVPPEATAGLYIALGRARTAEARQALFGIMGNTAAPVFERTRAMFALVDRDDVDVSLAQQLASYVGAIRSGTSRSEQTLGREATLALGALAGLQHNAEITQVARGAIEGILAGGGSAQDLRPAFGAIANVGDASLMHHAMEASRSRDSSLREAAAISFRRLTPSESGPMVAEWLGHEDDVFVQRRLYQTAYLQTVDAHAPVHNAVCMEAIADLETSTDLLTRKSIIRLLAGVADDVPEAREALMRQLPGEVGKREGLYDEIVAALSPEDIRAALVETL